MKLKITCSIILQYTDVNAIGQLYTSELQSLFFNIGVMLVHNQSLGSSCVFTDCYLLFQQNMFEESK